MPITTNPSTFMDITLLLFIFYTFSHPQNEHLQKYLLIFHDPVPLLAPKVTSTNTLFSRVMGAVIVQYVVCYGGVGVRGG